jgi:thiosulfate/3-mercaptopyruvate sulfurtransferase
MVETITATELRDRLDAGEQFALVDTRGEESFDSWRIPQARRYGFKPGADPDVDDFRRKTGLEPTDPVVTVCAKGISSYDFAEELENAGYADVTVVEGGMEAWSAVYDVADVPTRDGLAIIQVQRRAKGCLSYVVVDERTDVAAVVDTPRHVDRFRDLADERGFDVEHVFDTHVHADHISGGRDLADAVGATYYLGDGAAQRDVRYDYVPLERNEVVTIGEIPLKAVQAPGHTTEMVNFLVGGDAMLTGDTLFVDSVGRTELQYGTANAEQGARLLYESIHGSILAQPDETTILPSHFSIANDGSTAIEHGAPVSRSVGDVRTGLSLLQTDEETFVEKVTASLPERPANYETIIEINTGHRRPADETAAAALETGPNNCAATSD